MLPASRSLFSLVATLPSSFCSLLSFDLVKGSKYQPTPVDKSANGSYSSPRPAEG